MELSVKNRNGDVVGSVTLSDRVWSASSNNALLHQVVVAQLANRRQGTHETKTRGQVRYSTRKLRGQKHSGRARLGSRKSPTMVGGGVIFGPHARSYRQRIPKKMRRQALRVALSDKVRDQRLIVIDNFELDGPKTKHVTDLIEALELRGSTLMVVEDIDRDIMLSARGTQEVDVIFADGLNVLSAVKATNIVATHRAVEKIDSLWDDSKVVAGKAL